MTGIRQPNSLADVKILNLDHVAIAVEDLDAAIDGYRQKYNVEPLYREIVDSYRGEFRGGLVEFGLAEDGVGFSLDEHNRDLIPEEILDRVAALRDSIVDGSISVPFETGRS